MSNVFCVNSYFWLHSFYSKTLPGDGETLTGTRYRPSGGGKGVNQAFAAAYKGCKVEVIGRIGKDEPGRIFAEECASCGVGTRYMVYDSEHYTGCGCILRDEAGGNAIVIVPGVQDFLQPSDFDAAESYIRTCSIGGFQLEVNLDAVLYGIKRCSEWGIKTFVDPAPAVPLPKDIYPSIDYIKPNEHEATILTGIPVTGVDSAVEAGRWLLERGVREAAIITLGEKGCVVVTHTGVKCFPCPKVEVVDPTCAGDSFAGAFMAAIAQGKTLEEAIIEASELASLTVSVSGSMYNCFHMCDELYQRIHADYRKQLDNSANNH